MTFTYSGSPNAGRELVRLLIPDRDDANPVFSDAEIDALLALEGGSVKRAAAQALETMAASEAYVQKAIRLLDLQTNGPATAKSLMDRAALLRAQALFDEAQSSEGGFDIAEMVPNEFAEAERLFKQWQRSGAP